MRQKPAASSVHRRILHQNIGHQSSLTRPTAWGVGDARTDPTVMVLERETWELNKLNVKAKCKCFWHCQALECQ